MLPPKDSGRDDIIRVVLSSSDSRVSESSKNAALAIRIQWSGLSHNNDDVNKTNNKMITT